MNLCDIGDFIMIIIHKIKTFFINMLHIYSNDYSCKKLVWVVFLSVLFLPIYFFLISLLVLISALLLILFTPFYLIKAIIGDTYGLDDPIMSVLILPLSTGYYAAYLITFIPYVLIGLLCDLIAEIISYKRHKNEYVIIWPSVFSVPHKEAYPNKNYVNRM